ncbi:MAG: hypothetical protein LC131_07495 [Anaerolineae bacterium]|nr:hypothetical protein [Anaerolineae bacterium]
MNPVLWLLFGAAGVYLYTKAKESTGMVDTGTGGGTTTSTVNTDTGMIETKVDVPVLAPGATTPTTQTITQLTDPNKLTDAVGNPITQLSADDLARAQGYYVPTPPAPFGDVLAIVNRNNGDLRGVLMSLAGGWRTTSEGGYKLSIPDWNYYRQQDNAGNPIVHQNQVSATQWTTPLSQGGYLTLIGQLYGIQPNTFGVATGEPGSRSVPYWG